MRRAAAPVLLLLAVPALAGAEPLDVPPALAPYVRAIDAALLGESRPEARWTEEAPGLFRARLDYRLSGAVAQASSSPSGRRYSVPERDAECWERDGA